MSDNVQRVQVVNDLDNMRGGTQRVLVVGGGGSSLPDQTGHSGEFLTTDGTDTSWAAVESLPSQTGNSGKFLTTDGTDASWGAISQVPDTTGTTAGDVLTIDSNGDPSWQAGGGSSAPIAEVHTGSAVAPTAEGTNSLAVGNNAQAVQMWGAGDSATAIGNNSFAWPNCVSVGTSSSSGSYSVSVGYHAESSNQATAIGTYVTAGDGGIILGGYGIKKTGTDHAFDIVLNHFDAVMGINRHEQYTMCDIDGHIPPQRLGTGYDATKTQTLKNVQGVLTWVDD